MIQAARLELAGGGVLHPAAGEPGMGHRIPGFDISVAPEHARTVHLDRTAAAAHLASPNLVMGPPVFHCANPQCYAPSRPGAIVCYRCDGLFHFSTQQDATHRNFVPALPSMEEKRSALMKQYKTGQYGMTHSHTSHEYLWRDYVGNLGRFRQKWGTTPSFREQSAEAGMTLTWNVKGAVEPWSTFLRRLKGTDLPSPLSSPPSLTHSLPHFQLRFVVGHHDKGRHGCPAGSAA